MFNFFQAETQSLWLKDTPTMNLKPLSENIDAEVVVVGAGMSGLMCAYYLARAGKKVTVIEALSLLETQTTRSVGILSIKLDQHFHQLEKIHSKEKISKILNAQYTAQEDLIQIIHQENIDCDLKSIDGYVLGNESLKKEKKFIETILPEQDWAINLIKISENSTSPSLKMPRQYLVNPVKLLKGLMLVLEKMSVQFFFKTRILDFFENEDVTLLTNTGSRIHAKDVIFATHSPIAKSPTSNNFLSYQTYAMAFDVPKEIYPHGIYWGNENNLISYTITKLNDSSRDVLLVNGNDHRTGRIHNLYKNLITIEDKIRSLFPDAGKVMSRWSGQIIKTFDELPMIGTFDHYKHCYIATGFSRNGHVQSLISARIISDQILNQKNNWKELYLTDRFNLKCAPKLIREYAEYIYQYRQYLIQKDIHSMDQLLPNEGQVFSDKLDFIAAYKDMNGCFNFKSAICPHKRGIVSWNEVEHSWDCPGHGSRFDYNGDIISGPAVSSLDEKEISPLTPNGMVSVH